MTVPSLGCGSGGGGQGAGTVRAKGTRLSRSLNRRLYCTMKSPAWRGTLNSLLHNSRGLSGASTTYAIVVGLPEWQGVGVVAPEGSPRDGSGAAQSPPLDAVFAGPGWTHAPAIHPLGKVLAALPSILAPVTIAVLALRPECGHVRRIGRGELGPTPCCMCACVRACV